MTAAQPLSASIIAHGVVLISEPDSGGGMLLNISFDADTAAVAHAARARLRGAGQFKR